MEDCTICNGKGWRWWYGGQKKCDYCVNGKVKTKKA